MDLVGRRVRERNLPLHQDFRRAEALDADRVGVGRGHAGKVQRRGGRGQRVAADVPGARHAEVVVGRSNLLGALWWGLRKRIRGDQLL
jgi:hypothetical protein